MLGGVLRFSDKKLRAPKKISDPRSVGPVDIQRKTFPLENFPALIDAATCWRDRLLWILIAGTGLRPSEALNLQWQDIDYKNRWIYVIDPENRRFSDELAPEEKRRFKGRTVSRAIFFPPLEDWFFVALRQYIKHEYLPVSENLAGQFVFQYVEQHRRGKAFVNSSDAGRLVTFQRACRKIGAPHLGLHSLRHLYGDYMHNRLLLDLYEVQRLLGHKSPVHTQIYARRDMMTLLDRIGKMDQKVNPSYPSCFAKAV